MPSVPAAALDHPQPSQTASATPQPRLDNLASRTTLLKSCWPTFPRISRVTGQWSASRLSLATKFERNCRYRDRPTSDLRQLHQSVEVPAITGDVDLPCEHICGNSA